MGLHGEAQESPALRSLDSCVLYSDSAFDDSHRLCLKCVEELTESGDSLQLAEAYRRLAWTYWSKRETDSILYYYKFSEAIYRELHLTMRQAELANLQGELYYFRGELARALTEQLRAISIVESSPACLDSIHPYYTNVGQLLTELGEYERAMLYYQRSMEQYQSSLDHHYILTGYLYAEAAALEGDLEKSKGLIEDLSSLKPEVEYVNFVVNLKSRAKGLLYQVEGQYQKALDSYEEIQNVLGPQYYLNPEIGLRMAQVWTAQNRLDTAQIQYEKLLGYYAQNQHATYVLKLYRGYSEVLDQQGEFKRASEYKQRALELEEGLRKDKSLEEVRNFQLKELQKSNFLLADSRKQEVQKVNVLRWENRNWQMGAAFIFLILLMVSFLSVRLWKVRRQLMRSKAELEIQHQQLVEMNEERMELVSILGHDLRSPLWALRNFVDLIANGKKQSEDVARIKHFAIDGLAHFQEVLEQLIAWASSRKIVRTADVEKVELHLLVDEVVRGFRLHAETKQILLVNAVDIHESITSNERKLSIILRNLIGNAVKYTEQGRVEVGYASDNQGNYLYVKDTGMGMSASQIQEILHSEKALTSKGTGGEMGLGLGISTVVSLCVSLGYRLEIVSEEGIGTEARIWIGDFV